MYKGVSSGLAYPIAIGLWLVASGASHAGLRTWNDGANNSSTTTNLNVDSAWSGGARPANGDTAFMVWSVNGSGGGSTKIITNAPAISSSPTA